MLYLASKSPRRGELLRQLGLNFTTVDVEVAEIRGSDERPLDYIQRVATEKARAGAACVKRGAVVLGADTEVMIGDRVFGKPENELAAREMIETLAGCTHQVSTAVTLVRGERSAAAVATSQVRFVPMEPSQVQDYCATGEWRGKAGGYAIQGRAAAYIDLLAGSYSGVMGLPLCETAALIKEIGA